jgi:nitrilase
MHAEEGILYADIDPQRAATARRTLDVVGHYARPDIFTLKVDRAPQAAVEFNPLPR